MEAEAEEQDSKDKVQFSIAAAEKQGQEDEDDLLAWTWDPEACGPFMRVEEQGSSVLYRGADEGEAEIVWEYKLDNPRQKGDEGWKPWLSVEQVEIDAFHLLRDILVNKLFENDCLIFK